MNNTLTPFTFENQPVRVIERDGNPWFVAADVCAVLGIADVRQSVERLDDDERGGYSVPTPGGPQDVRCVSESGFYSLVLRSDKPQAKPFRKWVTSEVLPTIRKTGQYQNRRKVITNPHPIIDLKLAGSIAHSIMENLQNNLPEEIHAAVRDGKEELVQDIVELSKATCRRALTLMKKHLDQLTVEVMKDVNRPPTLQRVLEIIRNAGPKGISKRDLTRRTQFLDQRQRQDILQGLIDAGQILVETRPTRTIPVTVYRVA